MMKDHHSLAHTLRVHVSRLTLVISLLVLPLNCVFVDVGVVAVHALELGKDIGEQRRVLVAISVVLVCSFECLVVVD